jgi:hypothetical protein
VASDRRPDSRAIIGALVYDFFINHVLRARGEPPTTEVETRGEVVKEL